MTLRTRKTENQDYVRQEIERSSAGGNGALHDLLFPLQVFLREEIDFPRLLCFRCQTDEVGEKRNIELIPSFEGTVHENDLPRKERLRCVNSHDKPVRHRLSEDFSTIFSHQVHLPQRFTAGELFEIEKRAGKLRHDPLVDDFLNPIFLCLTDDLISGNILGNI